MKTKRLALEVFKVLKRMRAQRRGVDSDAVLTHGGHLYSSQVVRELDGVVIAFCTTQKRARSVAAALGGDGFRVEPCQLSSSQASRLATGYIKDQKLWRKRGKR